MSDEQLAKSYNISVEQLIVSRDVFNAFDEDKTKSISRSDYLEKLKMCTAEVNVEFITAELEAGGPDLSFEEYMVTMEKVINGELGWIPFARELEKFKEFDKDGNTELSQEEFKELLLKYGYSARVVDTYISNIFKQDDADGDGKISSKECFKYLVRVK